MAATAAADVDALFLLTCSQLSAPESPWREPDASPDPDPDPDPEARPAAGVGSDENDRNRAADGGLNFGRCWWMAGFSSISPQRGLFLAFDLSPADGPAEDPAACMSHISL